MIEISLTMHQGKSALETGFSETGVGPIFLRERQPCMRNSLSTD